MGFINGTDNGNTPTGGNLTQLVLDGTEYVSVEDAWGGSRFGDDLAPIARAAGLASSTYAKNLTSWPSGCITTAPLPPFFDQEKTTPDSNYVPHDIGTTSAGVLSATTVKVSKTNVYHAPVLTGLSAQPGTKPVGGNFFQRAIAAVEGWIQSGSVLSSSPSVAASNAVLTAPPVLVLASPVLTAPPVQVYHAPTQVMAPVATSDDHAPADQSYQLRFLLAGSSLSSSDIALSFLFGGVNGGNDFQYALYFHGDGHAELWEWAQRVVGGAFVFIQRASFPYCRPTEVVNRLQQITIFPHVGPNGERYIAFRMSAHVPNVLTEGDGPIETSDYLYKWDALTSGTIDGSPGHATGAGRWFLHERADLRHKIQVQKTAWETYGQLVEGAWELPFLTTDRPFISAALSKLPEPDLVNPTPVLNLCLRDTASQGILTTAGAAHSGSVYVSFEFFGSFFGSLILWGYSLYLPPVTQIIAPGAFTPPLLSAEVKGGEGDPRRESAAVTIEDPSALYPRLAVRGSFPARIQARVPVAGSPGTYTNVVLARGYVDRPHRTRRGQSGRTSGMTGSGPASAFPAVNWLHVELTFAGMWTRLTRVSTKTILTPKFFAFDSSAIRTGDALPGFQVTRMISYLLGRAGFPAAMVNIPDLPIRVQPGIGATINDFVIDPHGNIADLIITLARNYLGMFLVFDPNAGSIVLDTNSNTEGAPIGQWRLIGAGVPGTAPIAHFVTSVPDPVSGVKAVGSPAALPANTAYAIGNLESWTVPPEANIVRVVSVVSEGGRARIKIQNEMRNPYSYPAPGSTVTPDPNSAHYLGYEAPIMVADPTLWGGDGPDGLKLTQAAVDFTTRRIFEFACLPRMIQPCVARLLLITDAETGRLRPLRFYDPVSFNAANDYLVRNCNPSIHNSQNQQAYYELQKLVPMQTGG